MKFDDVLTVLGDFGHYQKLVFIALCLPIVLVGMQILSPVFTLATPRHRCAIPGLGNDTFHIQNDHHARLVSEYIPVAADGSLSSCNIYERYPDKAANRTTTVPCDRWVYDRSVFIDTVITETDLVCQRTLFKAHATTALNIGSLFGYLIMSPAADRFGRKLVYLCEVLLMAISATVLVWLPSIYLFIIIRGMIGFGFGVFYNITYVYAMEFVGPSKRTVCGMAVNYFWAVGLLIQTGLAYGLRSWRHLQLVMSLPFFAFLSYWWIIPQSARWLLSKRKLDEGRDVIQRIANFNDVQLKTQHLEIDIKKPDSLIQTNIIATLLELFKHRTLAIRACIVFVNWGVVSCLYYGLSLNVGNLGGDIYLNFAFSAGVEAVAYTLSIPGIVCMGRKKFHCTCMMIGGVSLLLTLVPVLYGSNSLQWLVIALAMVGKLVSSAAYATVYLFSAELFPTVVRSTTMGISAFFAGVGGMLAPYIVVLGDMLEGPFGKILPLLVFGISSIAAGLSALILPETGNTKLPDTIQDTVKDVIREPDTTLVPEIHTSE